MLLIAQKTCGNVRSRLRPGGVLNRFHHVMSALAGVMTFPGPGMSYLLSDCHRKTGPRTCGKTAIQFGQPFSVPFD